MNNRCCWHLCRLAAVVQLNSAFYATTAYMNRRKAITQQMWDPCVQWHDPESWEHWAVYPTSMLKLTNGTLPKRYGEKTHSPEFLFVNSRHKQQLGSQGLHKGWCTKNKMSCSKTHSPKTRMSNMYACISATHFYICQNQKWMWVVFLSTVAL